MAYEVIVTITDIDTGQDLRDASVLFTVDDICMFLTNCADDLDSGEWAFEDTE